MKTCILTLTRKLMHIQSVGAEFPMKCLSLVITALASRERFFLIFACPLVYEDPTLSNTKVYVKSRGTDCKNSDNFYILHGICVLSIGIDSCT